MSIAHTRAIVHAALDGKLDHVETAPDPVFGFEVPVAVPGVPAEVLSPREAWDDKDAFDRAARDLARRFHENFKEFEQDVDAATLEAGPRAE